MPVYPEVTIKAKVYIDTEDTGGVVIESITPTADVDAPEIVYRSFSEKKRWKQTGNCYRCGIMDFGFNPDESIRLLPNIVLEEGKQLGEKYSVLDTTYDTRKDIPNAPGYVEAGQANAKDLGVPYICGLQFEVLPWED